MGTPETTEFSLNLRGMIETARIPEFVAHLGGLITDLNVEVHFGSPEAELPPEVLANKKDFHEFGEALGVLKQAAGHYWFDLVDLFGRDLKRGAEPLLRFDGVPPRFHERPTLDSLRKNVADLDVHSLRFFLLEVQGATSRVGRPTYKGSQLSVKAVDFWIKFAEAKLPAVDTPSESA